MNRRKAVAVEHTQNITACVLNAVSPGSHNHTRVTRGNNMLLCHWNVIRKHSSAVQFVDVA